ncbi:MAG: hypothetical protein AAF634_15645 [Bacteroidota bacterium]
MRLLLRLFLALGLLTCCQPNKKTALILPQGKVGLIGYGSLTSSEQMAAQLGKPYTGGVEIVHLEGFQRTWTATTPNQLQFPPVGLLLRCLYAGDSIAPKKLSALNIQKNDSVAINCCFFIIDEEDLEPIDRTEKGYQRIEVTDKIREFNVSGGRVWAYQAMPEFTETPKTENPQNYAVAKLYLDFLEAGFSELGDLYREEFYETTLPIPEQIVLRCAMVSPNDHEDDPNDE